ncbi:MAG TPA: hypothetical protein VFJ91_05050 [Gaiellaceae bacterium]|nr:hypothetical protein [Gaiellaceae bacterium]
MSVVEKDVQPDRAGVLLLTACQPVSNWMPVVFAYSALGAPVLSRRM